MSARFPVSDHCDGERFFNSTGVQARSFSSLPRWWWEQWRDRTMVRWPKSVPVTRTPQSPASVPAGNVALTFIGHSTFLLQFPGLTVLTDPIFASHAGPFGWAGPKRVRVPAMKLAQLPAVDVVLVTHNHYDHLDLATIRWLTRERRPLFVTTLGNKAWLEKRGVANVVELDWWQSHRARPELEISCTPAHHFAARAPWDRCKSLWGGFYLKTATGPVYFCGDSGWAPYFAEIRAKLGAPALALMPVGAYEPRWFMTPVHMNPDEAVRAHLAVGARLSIGMHFGTFQLTDEGIDAPLKALAVARTAHGVPERDFTTLEFGETRVMSLSM